MVVVAAGQIFLTLLGLLGSFPLTDCTSSLLQRNSNGWFRKLTICGGSIDELSTPLPVDWTAFIDEVSGRTYYSNLATGETSWEIPPQETSNEFHQNLHAMQEREFSEKTDSADEESFNANDPALYNGVESSHNQPYWVTNDKMNSQWDEVADSRPPTAVFEATTPSSATHPSQAMEQLVKDKEEMIRSVEERRAASIMNEEMAKGKLREEIIDKYENEVKLAKSKEEKALHEVLKTKQELEILKKLKVERETILADFSDKLKMSQQNSEKLHQANNDLLKAKKEIESHQHKIRTLETKLNEVITPNATENIKIRQLQGELTTTKKLLRQAQASKRQAEKLSKQLIQQRKYYDKLKKKHQLLLDEKAGIVRKSVWRRLTWFIPRKQPKWNHPANISTSHKVVEMFQKNQTALLQNLSHQACSIVKLKESNHELKLQLSKERVVVKDAAKRNKTLLLEVKHNLTVIENRLVKEQSRASLLAKEVQDIKIMINTKEKQIEGLECQVKAQVDNNEKLKQSFKIMTAELSEKHEEEIGLFKQKLASASGDLTKNKDVCQALEEEIQELKLQLKERESKIAEITQSEAAKEARYQQEIAQISEALRLAELSHRQQLSSEEEKMKVTMLEQSSLIGEELQKSQKVVSKMEHDNAELRLKLQLENKENMKMKEQLLTFEAKHKQMMLKASSITTAYEKAMKDMEEEGNELEIYRPRLLKRRNKEGFSTNGTKEGGMRMDTWQFEDLFSEEKDTQNSSTHEKLLFEGWFEMARLAEPGYFSWHSFTQAVKYILFPRTFFQWRYVVVTGRGLDIYSPPVHARTRVNGSDTRANKSDLLLDQNSMYHSSSFPGKFLRVTTSKHAWLCEGNATDLSRRLLDNGYLVKDSLLPSDFSIKYKSQGNTSEKASKVIQNKEVMNQLMHNSSDHHSGTHSPTPTSLSSSSEGGKFLLSEFDLLSVSSCSWRFRSLAAPHLVNRVVSAIELMKSL